MPFSEDFDDVYQLGIKGACESSGAYCQRVDEQMFDGTILDRIYNQIAKADVIVADLTGRNPNVFYEVGYAHALGKRVILLVQEVEDIPFDLKQHAAVIYKKGKIAQLQEKLKHSVVWAIDHPHETLSRPEFGLEVFVRGEKLVPGIEIQAKLESFPQGSVVQVRFAVHNPSVRSLNGQIELIVGSSDLPLNDGWPTVSGPDGRYLHVMRSDDVILPHGWRNFDLAFRSWAGARIQPGLFDVSLQILTVAGFDEIPFTLVIESDR